MAKSMSITRPAVGTGSQPGGRILATPATALPCGDE